MRPGGEKIWVGVGPWWRSTREGDGWEDHIQHWTEVHILFSVKWKAPESLHQELCSQSHSITRSGCWVRMDQNAGRVKVGQCVGTKAVVPGEEWRQGELFWWQ